MIRIDYGETQDGPTVWLMIEGETEFGHFRELLTELSDGQLKVIDCRDQRDIFSFMSGVSSCLFASVAPSESGHVNLTNDDQGYSITWKLSRDSWRQALPIIDGITRASHQYFDYPEATVIVSLMEGLKRVAN
jgi:hypothetical protein